MSHNYCACDSKDGYSRQEMYLVAFFSQVVYEEECEGQNWQLTAERAPAEES